MDMRYKGMGVAGPISTAVTIPDDIQDGGFEKWTSASAAVFWTLAATVVRESTTVRTGTYSVKLPTNTTALQYLPWTTELRGNELTFTCYMLSNDVDKARLQIIDSAGSDAGAFHTGGGGWEQLTVTRTINAGATYVYLAIQNVAAGGDAYADDGALSHSITLTKGQPVAFANFNDELYLGAGECLFKLVVSGSMLKYINPGADCFTASITDLEPFTDNKLYIALGISDAYWGMTAAEAFTESTETPNAFQFFQRVDAAAPTMWGNGSAYQIYSSADPANAGANWSAATIVDTSYNSITDLITKSGALYIMKEDMPYYLSSAGAVQNDLAPELVSDTASTSGKNSFLWKNKLYIPFGAQGLLETDGTTNTFLNPASYCTNLSDFVGRVMAVTGDGEYLFVIVDNGTKNELLAGREETIDGTTGWVWHPIHELTLTPTSSGVETMWVSSVYQKRLWIASTSGSDDLYYIPLPTGYGNLLADANRSFKTGSYMITPYLHGNFKGDNKAFIKLVLTMTNTAVATTYFTVEYQLLGSTNWTTIPSTCAVTTKWYGATATGYIPVDDVSAAKPVGVAIRFRITTVCSTTDTPILLGYDCRAILYPTNRRIIECEVICDDEITLKDGTVERGQSATIKAALEEARNATWPITFYEIGESTIYVKFLPLQMAVTKKEKDRGMERHYLLRLQEIALS